MTRLFDLRGRVALVTGGNGGMGLGMAQDLALDEWHRVLDAHLTSALLCSRGTYPHMNRAGAGRIVNVGSMLSIFGASFGPVHGASKGVSCSSGSRWPRRGCRTTSKSTPCRRGGSTPI